MPTGLALLPSADSGATTTASPQPRLKRKCPVGRFSVTTTVAASGAVTLSIGSKSAFCALTLSSAFARSREKTTSEASRLVPSWKVTPAWRVKR